MAAERFPVESGHIMMFARAIGDPNPIYVDPDYAATTEVGHVIAPPTFVQASAQFDPDYPLRPKFGQQWFGSGAPAGASPPERSGSGSGSGGGSGTGLHAEQHYEYHRHVRPGDVLTAVTREGRSWEREGRRGGTLSFRESITEYRDQNGELVVTARGVGVRTSRTVEGD
jgi:hypothetical protein